MREAIPGQSAYRDSWHMHRDLDKAVAGYMYTLLTGKSALGDEPADQNSAEWRTWTSHKIGYETAWTLMNLDGNPPGALVQLPVELLDFTVRPKKNTAAILNWTTASEIPNSGFHIERSSDEANWNAIGFIEGQEASSTQQEYEFEDEGIIPGLYYYRLRQVDLGGNFAYSPIRSVTISSRANPFGINVFPNPLAGGNLTVTISDAPREGKAQVIDMLGRVMHQQSFSGSTVTINTDGLSPGAYWLTIRMDNDSWEQKIVVR